MAKTYETVIYLKRCNCWIEKKGSCFRSLFIFWRKRWDLNPRRAINPCQFSRLVLSTAQPPFLISTCEKARILRDFVKYSMTTTDFLSIISTNGYPALTAINQFKRCLTFIANLTNWLTWQSIDFLYQYDYNEVMSWHNVRNWEANALFKSNTL